MTREALNVKIRRDVTEEADHILGELSRLMSPELRSRAELVVALARVGKFPVPAPIAWMLDLQDVETTGASPKQYPPGTEGLVARLADQEGIGFEEARTRLRELFGREEEPVLRGRAARVAEQDEAAQGEEKHVVEVTATHPSSEPADKIDVPVTRKVAAPKPSSPPAAPEARVEGVAAEVAKRTTKPPVASVSVRPATSERTGPPPRPRLDVEHVTVRAKGTPKPAVTERTPKAAAKAPSTETYVRSDGAVRAKPGHPGPEALPEYLRSMPAAHSKIPLSKRLPVAEDQLRVLKDIQEHPGTLVPEIALRLSDIAETRISQYTRDLMRMDTPLVRKNGKTRVKHGNKSGRPGNELEAVEGGLPPTLGHPRDTARAGTVTEPASSAERPTRASGGTGRTRGTSTRATVPVAKPAVPSGSQSKKAAAAQAGPTTSEAERVLDEGAARTGTDLKGAELLSALRNFAVSMEDKGDFGVTQAADAVGVPVAAAEFGLDLLAEQARGAVVVNVGVPGLARYEYNKMRPGAAGAGAAALRDKETAKSRNASNGTSSVPVSGTGRDWVNQFSGVKEVQRLVRMAEQKWPGSVSKRGSKHIMVKPPGHQPITIGANSKGNALRKDQKNLESAGLVGAIG